MPAVRGEKINRSGVAAALATRPAPPLSKTKQTSTPADFADHIATLKIAQPALLEQDTRRPWDPNHSAGRTIAPPLHYTPSRNSINLDRVVSHAVDHVLHPKTELGPDLGPAFGSKSAIGKVDPNGTGVYAIDKQGHLHESHVYGGTISPGTGLIAQTLAGLADQATYSPAGVKDLVAHPERTVQHIAKSVEQTVEDPLHHPANALLLGWAGVSGALGASSRLAAAGGALKGGEGISRALARPSAEGGSMLHSPPPAPRTFTVGSKEIDLVPSRNKAFNLLQQGHDKVLRKALRDNPEGRVASYATKRLGGSLTESRRATEEQQRVPGNLLDAAGRGLKPEEQLALRMAAENTPVANLRRFHEHALDDWGAFEGDAQPTGSYDKTGHIKQLGLLGRIEKKGLLGADEHGNVVINATDHPRLAEADRRLAEAGTIVDKHIEATGERTPEGLKSRRDAPAKVVAGAKYEKPTPGKQGVESQTLIKARARVARIEALHQRALTKAAEKAVPYENVHTRTGLVKQNLKSAPEAALKRQHVEVAPGPKTPGEASALPAKGLHTPTVERLGAALSVAKDDLQRLEQQAAARVKPTGFVGGDTAREGRTYVSYRLAEKKPPAALFGKQGASGTIGRQEKLLAGQKTFTGEGLEHGLVPDNTTALAARDLQRAARHMNTDRFRRDIAKAGSETRQTDRDVLVNTQELENAKVPDEIHAALGNKLLTLHELENHGSAFEQLRRRIFPEPNDLPAAEQIAAREGTKVEGHVWVDRNLLGELAQETPRLKAVAGKAVGLNDAINNAQKMAITYTKPGHFATRGVTNAALNILEGSGSPVGITKSVRLWHRLDTETRERMLATGGQGYSKAVMGPEMGLGMKAVAKGANFWARIDDPFRFNAVAYELRRLGYRTPAQLKALYADYEAPANAKVIDQASKFAQRENIDYARLGPKEREIVRRVFFYYPWVKGATLYAGRFVAEHPIKAAALGLLGEEGHQQANKDLGAVPSIQDGLMKIGGSAAAPLVSNPKSVALFSTPAEVTRAFLSLAGGDTTRATELSNFLTPSLKLGVNEAFRLGPYGQKVKPGVSSTDIARQTLIDGTPEATAWRRLRDAGALGWLGVKPTARGADQSRAMLPVTDARGVSGVPGGVAVEQPLFGSWFPRPANRSVLNAQAVKEQEAAMSPAVKIAFVHAQAAKTLQQLAQQRWPEILDHGQIPPEWRQAVSLRQQRLQNLAALGVRHGDKHFEQKAYVADVKLLGKLGTLTPQEVAEAVTFAKTATEDRLRLQRLRIGHTLFRGFVLAHAKRSLKDRGADVTPLPW